VAIEVQSLDNITALSKHMSLNTPQIEDKLRLQMQKSELKPVPEFRKVRNRHPKLNRIQSEETKEVSISPLIPTSTDKPRHAL
jgi:hypothetical protein